MSILCAIIEYLNRRIPKPVSLTALRGSRPLYVNTHPRILTHLQHYIIILIYKHPCLSIHPPPPHWPLSLSHSSTPTHASPITLATLHILIYKHPCLSIQPPPPPLASPLSLIHPHPPTHSHHTSI